MRSLAKQPTRFLETIPFSTRPAKLCQRCHARLISTSDIHYPSHSRPHLSSPLYRRYTSNAPPPPSTSQPTKPTIQTYYDLFPRSLPRGPPPQGPFHIDPRRLRQEFLQLQSGAHPDRHPASARVKAEAMSTYINEAYKMLQSPLLRAQYLLSLRGVETAEDETAKVHDPDLLMQVLEIRELMEEARDEGDLRGLKEENEKRIERAVEELAKAFERDDLPRAKEETIRLRYWVNVKESLEDWEPGKEVVMHH